MKSSIPRAIIKAIDASIAQNAVLLDIVEKAGLSTGSSVIECLVTDPLKIVAELRRLKHPDDRIIEIINIVNKACCDSDDVSPETKGLLSQPELLMKDVTKPKKKPGPKPKLRESDDAKEITPTVPPQKPTKARTVIQNIPDQSDDEDIDENIDVVGTLIAQHQEKIEKLEKRIHTLENMLMTLLKDANATTNYACVQMLFQQLNS